MAACCAPFGSAKEADCIIFYFGGHARGDRLAATAGPVMAQFPNS
jgi:hypothetical protein